jgi:diguanylate cyclase (GGDEF)-like protein/PAS domain S-box-containing protein
MNSDPPCQPTDHEPVPDIAAAGLDGSNDIVALYRRVVEHSPLPIAMTIGQGHVLCGANPAFCELLGVEVAALLGQSLIGTMPTADTDHVRTLLDQAFHTGMALLGIDPPPILLQHDHVSWSYSVWPIPDEQGRPVGLVLLIHDISAHHRDEQAVIDTRAINEQLLIAGLRELALSEQLQRQLAFTTAITNSLGEGLYTLDHEGRFMMVNPAAERMLGWMEAELIGRNVYEIIPGQVAASVGSHNDDASVLEFMRSGMTTRDEQALWSHRDGTQFATAYSAAPIITDGQVVGAVVVFRDTTKVRQATLLLARQARELASSHAKLEHVLAEVQALALTDELTGLYNRRGFLTLAAQQMKVAKRTQHALSLMFIDLDGLKGINDQYGHQVGNEAITLAARILTATFRDSDIIARFGGDEFVVLAMDSDAQDSDQVFQRIETQCAQYNQQENSIYQLSMSMGIAYSTIEHPCLLDELLEQADAQMYLHKQAKHPARDVNDSNSLPSAG